MEIRLEELDSVVDYFVLVEGNLTHQAKPKPLYFSENKGRFKKFLHKIIHRVVDLSVKPGPWEKEEYQRDYILKVLRSVGCRGSDIIHLSDLDEITRASSLLEGIKLLKNRRKKGADLVFLEHDCHALFLNGKIPEVIEGAFVTTFAFFKSGIAPSKLHHFHAEFREYPRVKNAGWHLTWIGSPEEMVQKVNGVVEQEAYAGGEHGKVNFWKQVHENKVHLNGVKVSIFPVDNTFPKAIQKNVDLYIERGLVLRWD